MVYMRKTIVREVKIANNRIDVMANYVESSPREIECLEKSVVVNKENAEDTMQQNGEMGTEEEGMNGSTNLQESNNSNLRFGELRSPSFLVRSRNNMEHDVEQDHSDSSKRRNYRRFSAEERWHIGVIASEMGTTRAIRQLEKQYPDLKLAESTVRSFKNRYVNEQRNRKETLISKVEKTIRGRYQRYSEKDRAVIGKYANANGSASAIRYFKDLYPRLSESTVRGFKNMYTKELEKRAEEGNRESYSQNGATICCDITKTDDSALPMCSEEVEPLITQTQTLPLNEQHSAKSTGTGKPSEITSLPRLKRGRPGKIPSRIEALIVTYLRAIAEKDIKLLTHHAVIAITKGVLMVEDR